jgi:outer membrane protein OmpA-like peptidoglycan-associated protein
MSAVHRAAALAGVLGLVGLTGYSLTACSRPDPCPTTPVAGIAIAVGNRANSPAPTMPEELRPELSALIDMIQGQESAQGVTFISVDGAPAVRCVIRFDSELNNDIARDKAKSDAFATVSQIAQALPAGTEEVDVLAALDLAARSAQPGGVVVLVDSGLQTLAPLNFTELGLLDADPGSIADELARRSALPDLHDRTVILAGIGYTALPQPPLDSARIDHLAQIWSTIATRGGASSVVVSSRPNTHAAPTGVPAVSTVPVPARDNIQLGCNTTSVFTNDSSVGFDADSTTFRDPGRAATVLSQYGSWLRDNPSDQAVVTGNVAHYGTDEGDGGLAQARARRVRDALVAAGASTGQVTAKGDGWGPVPAKDAPPGAAYDELNRRVVIDLRCP